MANIAIIPARGGSKRIPRKNIKKFCDEPIIRYSIENALESGIFSDVVVSTEDTEIAELARTYGAKVPFLRDTSLSDDYSTTGQVILSMLIELEKYGYKYEYFACLYPTAPFMTPEKIKEAMELLKEEKANEVITVVKYSSPPQRGFVYNDGKLTRKWPEYENLRNQDLEPLYYDAGQFYGYYTDAYLKANGCIADKIVPYILLSTEVQDIDNLDDWLLAEMKYGLLKRKEQ